MNIVGQNKSILDPTRIIKCGTCSLALSVQEAQGAAAVCPKCSSRICVYCGCSDAAACFHPDYPRDARYNCEWKEVGMCSRCFSQIAELEYHSIDGDEDLIRPFMDPIRPSVLGM